MPPITLTSIATGFNNPIGIDHHEPTGQVVLSVNYPNGLPSTFELVADDGTRTTFSTVTGLTDEVKVATVRSSPNQAGFVVGDVYTGSGDPGVIVRISADGQTVDNPWVTLPGEPGLLRGGLFQDRYGAFDGDLIVVTNTGGVWRVTSGGVPTQLANLGVHLEGVTTVPKDVRYGPWSAKIVVGAEQQGLIHTIDAAGNTDTFELGIAPEDIEIIPAGENFIGIDHGSRSLMGAPASDFAGIVGDILIAQEIPGLLWHVRWDSASGTFQTEEVAQVGQWEHVTFSTSKLIHKTEKEKPEKEKAEDKEKHEKEKPEKEKDEKEGKPEKEKEDKEKREKEKPEKEVKEGKPEKEKDEKEAKPEKEAKEYKPEKEKDEKEGKPEKEKDEKEGKPEKEKDEKEGKPEKEVKEGKPEKEKDEKEAKPEKEAKEGKPEKEKDEKEAKPEKEIKEGKPEKEKDEKDCKPEKEFKNEKLETPEKLKPEKEKIEKEAKPEKEIKEAKPEKEVEKQIEKGIAEVPPAAGADPALDRNALLAQVRSLEQDSSPPSTTSSSAASAPTSALVR